jgi:formylglycine-generating enzyme required for sulfatase activity
MDNKILRGGSWITPSQFCRSAFRDRGFPVTRYSDLGFRVCCSKPPNPFKLFLQKMYKIIRGGGWYSPPQGCRSAYRSCDHPYFAISPAGFRVVCLPQGPSLNP